MSKAIKMIAIIAGGLIAVGVFMLSITIILGVDVTHILDAINHEEEFSINQKVEENLAEIENITVDVDYQEVILKQGETFHIAYKYDSDYSSLTHEIKNGSLVVMESRKEGDGLSGNLLDIIKKNQGFGKIVITYPKGTNFRDVRVESDMGKVTADDFSARNLQVDVDLGSIGIKNVHAQTLQISAAAGDVLISDGSADRAELELDLGSLRAENWETKGLVADLNGGEAMLNGVFLGETDVDCDLGDVKLEIQDLKEKYSYELDVDLGSIQVDGEKIKGGMFLRENAENKLNISAGAGDITLTFEAKK